MKGRYWAIIFLVLMIVSFSLSAMFFGKSNLFNNVTGEINLTTVYETQVVSIKIAKLFGANEEICSYEEWVYDNMSCRS